MTAIGICKLLIRLGEHFNLLDTFIHIPLCSITICFLARKLLTLITNDGTCISSHNDARILRVGKRGNGIICFICFSNSLVVCCLSLLHTTIRVIQPYLTIFKLAFHCKDFLHILLNLLGSCASLSNCQDGLAKFIILALRFTHHDFFGGHVLEVSRVKRL